MLFAGGRTCHVAERARSAERPALPGVQRPVSVRLALAVVVLDLALGDLLQGHGQVVLRARLDERRRGLFEAHALAELVVVVVDLPRALGGDDDQRVARVDTTGVRVQQFVDARMDHEPAMVPAAASSCWTSAESASVARSTSSLRTM